MRAVEQSKQRFPAFSLSLEQHRPYLLAAIYALAISVFIARAFPDPPPRFMDLYLIGVVFMAARWSMGPALLVYTFSLVFASRLLRPRGSLAIADDYDVYRMLSYSACALSAILAIRYAKSRDEG
jgi:K+-sensing histidine kinase KdpD